MDNVTHTLVAATLGRTALSRLGRGTTAALLLGSNAPDIDIIATAGGTLAYLDWHRGVTHGVLGVVGLGVMSAALVWQALRWLARRDGHRTSTAPPASFRGLVAAATLGAAVHVCMDLPTSYGTRVLSPFDEHWFTTDWMPIIDVYLLGILAAGLALGRSRRMRQSAAIAVLVLTAGNYALRAVTHRQAIRTAPAAFGSALPPPCPGTGDPEPIVVRWSRSPRVLERGGGECLMEIAAIPTFTSPFSWRLIAQTSSAYETQTISVLHTRAQDAHVHRRSGVRRANQWTSAVLRAAGSDVGRRFLSFARYPAVRSILEADGSTTVTWVDVRFDVPLQVANESIDRSGFFAATVRVGKDGSILEQRLGR